MDLEEEGGYLTETQPVVITRGKIPLTSQGNSGKLASSRLGFDHPSRRTSGGRCPEDGTSVPITV